MDTKKFLQHKEIQAAISELRLFLDIAYATVHTVKLGEKSDFILLIILSHNDTVLPSAIDDLTEKIIGRHLAIRFRIMNREAIIDQIKKANLYFINWYLDHRVIYESEEFKKELAIAVGNIKQHFERSAKSITKKIGTAEAIQRGAQHYADRHSYLLALYTIHQSIILSLEIASGLVYGKAITLNYVWKQQRYVAAVYPEVAVFNASDDTDCGIVALLQKVAKDFPYFENLKPKKEQVSTAYKKLQLLLKIVRSLYQGQLTVCREKLHLYLSHPENNNPPSEGDEPKIVRIIRNYLEVDGIYCYGKNKNNPKHYYLLVFEREHKENAVHDLAEIIKSKTKGQLSVTMLIHPTGEFTLAKGEQRTFFLATIRNGDTLFQSGAMEKILTGLEMPERDYSQAINYLCNRSRIVSQISDWQGEYEWANYSPLKAVMLHHIVEQACLGMLKLFLGYSPNHFALGYLLELCEYFAPLAGTFFPRNTSKDKKLFKLLNRHPWTLRYSGDDDIAFEDMDVLQDRCNDFADYTKSVVEKELERLGNPKTDEFNTDSHVS